MNVPHVLEGVLLCGKHLGTQDESTTCPNPVKEIQTAKQDIEGIVWCELHSSRAASPIDHNDVLFIFHLLTIASRTI